LSEAMVTAARMKWKEALASERQSMLEALERIKPQIERLGNESMLLADLAAAKPLASPGERPLTKRVAETCSACGTDFFDENESFCGTCGAARPATLLPLDMPSADVAGKMDPPWLIPYGKENPGNGNSAADLQPTQSVIAKETAVPAAPPPPTVPEVRPMPPAAAAQTTDDLPSAHFQPPVVTSGTEALRIVPADPIPENPLQTSLVPADPLAPADKLQPYPWGSARKAQEWLETVKTHQGPRAEWLAQQWQRRRANIYVVMAGFILLLVISGWGIRPAGTKAAGNAAPAQNSQPQPPPPPQLTLFEKLMVNLGLAEPPPVPVDMGNPTAQVWVDVHTALYYCSGSDLYGKTADGKFTTQRDAQQDQFEPSNRKACP
jgi:ribosomal protein L37E